MAEAKKPKQTESSKTTNNLPFDSTALLSIECWTRLLYMIFFGAIGYLVCMGILLISLFQFVAFLFTGKKNSNLLDLSQNLCDYIRQIFTYLTFLHDDKPFPFSSWNHKK